MSVEKHARVSPALVETIAGLSAGTISTLVVHPLDVIKTRLQIHRNTSNRPISGFQILGDLISKQAPVQSLYRGLSPNLVGNASSWAIFFWFKSIFEDQMVLLRANSSTVALRSDGFRSNARNGLTPADYFVASGFAGAMITICTNPIWVLKTRMLSSDKGSEGAYKSMWQGARQIWHSEGPRGFYRGVAVSLVGTSHGAVQFAVYDPLKKAWRRYSEQLHARNTFVDTRQEEKLGIWATLIISGASKVVAGTVTYPYQVLRSRLQTYNSEQRFGRGIREVTRRVWKEDGWGGFYKGLGTNILRILPATWVTFVVYENVRYYFTHAEVKPEPRRGITLP